MTDLDRKARFQQLKSEFAEWCCAPAAEREEFAADWDGFFGTTGAFGTGVTAKAESAADDDEAIEAVLLQLKVEGLQSDERFTESYVHHRVNAESGRLKYATN